MHPHVRVPRIGLNFNLSISQYLNISTSCLCCACTKVYICMPSASSPFTRTYTLPVHRVKPRPAHDQVFSASWHLRRLGPRATCDGPDMYPERLHQM